MKIQCGISEGYSGGRFGGLSLECCVEKYLESLGEHQTERDLEVILEDNLSQR